MVYANVRDTIGVEGDLAMELYSSQKDVPIRRALPPAVISYRYLSTPSRPPCL